MDDDSFRPGFAPGVFVVGKSLLGSEDCTLSEMWPLKFSCPNCGLVKDEVVRSGIIVDKVRYVTITNHNNLRAYHTRS